MNLTNKIKHQKNFHIYHCMYSILSISISYSNYIYYIYPKRFKKNNVALQKLISLSIEYLQKKTIR